MTLVRNILIGINVLLTVWCYSLIPSFYSKVKVKYAGEEDLWLVPVVMVSAILIFWILGGLWFPFFSKKVAARLQAPAFNVFFVFAGLLAIAGANIMCIAFMIINF